MKNICQTFYINKYKTRVLPRIGVFMNNDAYKIMKLTREKNAIFYVFNSHGDLDYIN